MCVCLNFFCEKFSDLDNMLPIVFALLESDEDAEAAIYWYGEIINFDSACLLRYAQRSFSPRLLIWVPSRKGFSLFNDIEQSSLPVLLQSLLLHWRVLIQRIDRKWLGCRGAKRLGARAAEHLLDYSPCKKRLCFFGFTHRAFLVEIAERIKHSDSLWVRLPQGVIFTLSVFRTVTNITDPEINAVSAYLPAWADLAIEVDSHINTHYADVSKNLGISMQLNNGPFLGAPRFSRRWIKHIDEAYLDVESRFPSASKQQNRILFLLTPWHKNIWYEEVLRVLEIIASYDVDLVIKGFHANTSQVMTDKSFNIDECTPTSALIRDSDVVFFIATSSALDGFMRGKEMLQLSYLHGNQTSLEKRGLGIAAHSRDDVHLRMNRLVQTGSILFDGEELNKIEAEQFIHSEIVGMDPMSDYATYIKMLVMDCEK